MDEKTEGEPAEEGASENASCAEEAITALRALGIAENKMAFGTSSMLPINERTVCSQATITGYLAYLAVSASLWILLQVINEKGCINLKQKKVEFTGEERK